MLTPPDARQLSAVRIRCRELELRCGWYLQRIRELEAYSVSTFVRQADPSDPSPDHTRSQRPPVHENGGGARSALSARELVSLRRALTEKQIEIDRLTLAAGERLQLIERAARDRAVLKQALDDLAGVAEERLRLVDHLIATADERLEAMEELRSAADERLRLNEELEAVANERLRLIERLHVTAAERLQTIENLQTVATERLRLIEELQATEQQRRRDSSGDTQP